MYDVIQNSLLQLQRIASLNKQITTEVYDIQHFKQLKDQYQIMSVPCMVINDQKVVFGKKNIEQILEIIENGIKKQSNARFFIVLSFLMVQSLFQVELVQYLESFQGLFLELVPLSLYQQQ